jgi:hypothetical protein
LTDAVEEVVFIFELDCFLITAPLETEKTMKHLGAAMGFGMAIVGAMTQPAAPDPLSRDMAARIEAIPIQTLTISLCAIGHPSGRARDLCHGTRHVSRLM